MSNVIKFPIRPEKVRAMIGDKIGDMLTMAMISKDIALIKEVANFAHKASTVGTDFEETDAMHKKVMSLNL